MPECSGSNQEARVAEWGSQRRSRGDRPNEALNLSELEATGGFCVEKCHLLTHCDRTTLTAGLTIDSRG